MNKIISLSIAAAMNMTVAMSVHAAGETPAVVTGKTYRIVAGLPGAPTANDQRPSSCFGVREIDGTDFLGVDAVAAEKPSQIWTFTSTADNPEVYAITNGAGQYINPVAGLYPPAKAGTVYQDARFELVSYTNELPAAAYGFAIVPLEPLTEEEVAAYANTDISGMEAGDLRCRIKPLQYRNNAADPEQIVENTADNAPANATAQNKPPYYMNIAGAGRQFLINLWFVADACQSVVLVPTEHTPDIPEFVGSPSISGVTPDAEGNVVSGSKEEDITMTAAEGAKILYKYAGEEEFTEAPTNPYTLKITGNCTLEFCAEKGSTRSEVKSINFTFLTVVEAAKSYRIVSGLAGTPTAGDSRPSSCFGLREIDGKAFLGVAAPAEDDPSQIWKFTASTANPAVYAIANEAGQYINPVAALYKQGNAVYQDSRFEVEEYADELPESAYGFAIVPLGTLTAEEVAAYADTELTGMEAGNVRCRIKPLKYRNSFTDPDLIVDNTAENAPANATAQNMPPYYLNIAGAGRKFLINLWFVADDCQSVVLVPAGTEEEQPTAPAAPELSGATPDENNTVTIKGTEVDVTLTAVINADIMYRFTPTEETAGEFTAAPSNPYTLTIDKSGVLEYYAAKGENRSETKTVTFKILTTGIAEIDAKGAARDEIYDLSGRRLTAAKKGIYIVNGKKVIRH